MRFRVGSYNIRLGLEQGLEAVATTLRGIDADVVALQEIGCHWTMGECVDQVAMLAERAGYAHQTYCATLHRGAGQFGHAVLSRIPLQDVRHWELPQTRDETRRFQSARLVLPDGLEVTLVTLHLSHLDDERPPQVEALFAWLAEQVPRGPLLVVGDLNEPNPAHLSARVTGAGLTDCGAAEAVLTFPTRAPVDRRDVVLQRGFTVLEALTVGTSAASDHLPIVVGLAPASSPVTR